MRCPVLHCEFEGDRNRVIMHLENHQPQIGGSAASSLHIHPFLEIRAFRGYMRTYRHRFSESGPRFITAGDYLKDVERAN
ncbi:unnamed protein product [Orchesella dallaii]|uniref:Uncharacterized protein n=1 Tax=Orchesella dallaii TaxID=48710 RepID=A0ABP1RR94_9HEXA